MEAGESALYLFSACTFATILRHPASPIRQHLPSDMVRRILTGLAMGGTITGSFSRPWDAKFDCATQFLGAATGVALAMLVLEGAPASHSVRYAGQCTGIYGDTIAFVAELAISFILMTAVLFASNHEVPAR